VEDGPLPEMGSMGKAAAYDNMRAKAPRILRVFQAAILYQNIYYSKLI
jgi:hypothetical protein